MSSYLMGPPAPPGFAPQPDPLAQFGYNPEEMPAEFQPVGFHGNSLLESLAGLQGLQLPQPHSFGQGLLYGLAGGLGTAGSRIAQARQNFEAQQAQQRAKVDAERARISQENRQSQGRAEVAQATYQRTHPILTQQAADASGNPALQRLVGQPVPEEWTKPSTEKSLDEIRAEAKARAEGTAQGAGDMVPALSPDALDGVARAYGTMGNAAIPPGGRGKERQAFVTKIVNRSFELNPGANIPLNQADYKTARSELGKFQPARDLFDTATKQVDYNIGKAADMAKQMPDTGTTLLNTPLRNAANVLGSTKYREFLTYITAARREYSKISGSMMPGGVAEVSEGVRKQMEPILSDGSTVGQILAAGNAIHNEGSQLVSNFDTHIGEIRGRMGASGGGQAQNFDVKAPNGKTYRFKDQASANKFRRDAGIQ